MSSILFLTQLLPYPLDAGPKTRAYYVLRHVARSHQVTLLSFSRLNDSQEAIAHLKEFCREVITVPMPRSVFRNMYGMAHSILTNQPFIISRDIVPGMTHVIEKTLQNTDFDYVHADQLWMAQYALKARSCAISGGKKLRVVLDQHNAVYLIPKRLKLNTRNPVLNLFLGREARLLAKFETEVCRECDQVVWVTVEDFEAICEVQRDCLENPVIIPICVDPAAVEFPVELSKSPNILFLGGMHWPPNAEGVKWFVREVLPRIRRVLPESQLVVVGKSPPREIMDMEGVRITGFIEDVSAFWKASRVLIVPIQAAGGMRVKILDAWAHGLPVISTSIGAEGIVTEHGRNILIADDAEDFARSVVQILNDESSARSISLAGHETLEENYDWKRIYQSWDEIYQPAS